MDLDSDVQDFEQATAADCHLARAWALEEQDHPDVALSECDAAIAAARAFLADAYNLRGVLLEDLMQNQAALEAYHRALLLAPSFQEAADNLRELETALGMGHDLVTMMKFITVGEAYVVKGKLASEGVWAFVADEFATAAFGLIGTPIGGIRLQVREADLERAFEILGIEVGANDEGVALTCPKCQATDIRVPLLGETWRCKRCGHKWIL